MNKRSIHRRDRDSEQGFVLVYVLAVIAVLSLLTIVAANNLRLQQSLLHEVSDRNVLSKKLNEAEVITIFVFLSSPIVSGGLDLSGRAIDESELALGEPIDETDLSASQVWSVFDGRRVLVFDDAIVTITYQDADGLVSLNSADQTVLSAWYEHYTNLDLDEQDFAAKVADYTDADTIRRFRGAERADYRVAGLPTPLNSPVRSLREVQQIYGMKDFDLSRVAYPFRLTFFSNARRPRSHGMPSDLNEALEKNLFGEHGYTDDLTGDQLVNSRFPSERAQFVLSAYAPDSNLILHRVVEIERTAAAPDQPFKMRQIMETATTKSRGDIELFSTNHDVLIELPNATTVLSE